MTENMYRFYHCYPHLCKIECKRVYDIQEYQSIETNTHLIETNTHLIEKNPNYIAIPNYIPKVLISKY